MNNSLPQYNGDAQNQPTRVQTWDKTTRYRQMDYRYDLLDRRIEKAVNSDDQGAADVVERFVYNGVRIALACSRIAFLIKEANEWRLKQS
jgi:hypothetical protein